MEPLVPFRRERRPGRRPRIYVIFSLILLGLLWTEESSAQLFTKVGSFIAPTAGPPTTSITGTGFTPRAVIFFWTSQTTAGFATSAAIGYGFATGLGSERAIAFVSDNNLYPNNPVRWQWTNRSFVVMNSSAAGTTNCEGQLNSMDADGFTVAWAKKGSAWIIHYLALGGPDIVNATIGSFTPAAGTGSEPITGVGFRPDFLMFLSNDTNTVAASVTHGKVAIGFAGLSAGSTITQGALSIASRSGGANINTSGAQTTTGAILEKDTPTASLTMAATVTSFDADGFTIDKTTHTGGTETTTHYLALQGGQYTVGAITKPHPTEAPPTFSQPYTGVGFTPHGLFFASWNLTAGVVDQEARISFSAADTRGSPPNQRATFFHDKIDFPNDADNSLVVEGTLGTDVTNGQVVHLAQAGDCYPNPLFSDPVGSAQCSGPARLISTADVTSYDADGFTLDWTTNDNTNANQAGGDEDNAQILYVAFGNDETTAVTLASFTAEGGDRSVLLEWETASEVRNLGFHLYRADTEGGPYERITASPIPGLGTSSTGTRYSFRDSGLENDRTYFYKLEDIDRAGVTEMHGPVLATPRAQGVLEASPTVYGNPSANRFTVSSWTRKGAILELVTEGFHAEPLEDGTVRLSIPGFDFLSEPGRMSIPVIRPWVDAVAGLGVKLVSVQEEEVARFEGLRPSGTESFEAVGSRDGTVSLIRRRRSALSRDADHESKEAARIVSTGFQGGVKKFQLELAPLRWDARSGRIVLARRLLVTVSFQGRAPDETGYGRRSRVSSSRRNRTKGQGKLAHLSTTKAGLHAVCYEDVSKGRDSFPARELRLSRLGVEAAFHLEPQTDRFGPGSCLYFVSAGPEANPYGNEAVYELELGAGGKQMERGVASPSGERVPYFWKTEKKEVNRYYQAALTEAPDLWLWDVLFAPAKKAYGFEVGGIHPGAGPSRLSVWLQGASDFEADPDHHLRVSVNGSQVGEVSFGGKTAKRVDLELPPGTLAAGENVLELLNIGDTEAPYSMVFLDRFEVSYPRLLETEQGRLEGAMAASGTAVVAGVGSKGYLLKVTAEDHPVWLSGARSTEDGALRFRAEALERYLVVEADAVGKPQVRRPPSAVLESVGNEADYLVIAPRAFLREVQPLLRLRQEQGLRAKLVLVEQVYAEFGFGEERPEAIRSFLEYAYHAWRPPRLRYVLLVGDGTYDAKGYLGSGVVNRIPPLPVKTSFLWTASDPTLSAVNGDDILPDLAIGRLPAATEDEARVMVGKILAYETGGVDLSGRLVLVADDPDSAGDFEASAEEIAFGVLEGRDVRILRLRRLGASAARAAIQGAYDTGASLMSYVGHGGIQLWANENIFNTSDMASLSPQPRQPLFVTMNCLNGYFHFPYFDSLAEAVLKAEDKGAIAAFSPTGLSLNAPAGVLHRALLDQIFNEDHARLGDALLAAQAEYAASGSFPELLRIYHLLGDPALELR